MKKIIFLLLSMFLSFQSIAIEPITNLIIWAKDGTKVVYALFEKPKVIFTETDLIIMAQGSKVNYALENMACFTYELNDEITDVNLQTNESLFKFNGEYLLFPVVKANTTISIYSIDGILILSKTISRDGEYIFPLSSLSSGIYIVNVNGLTCKIAKE